MNPIKFSTLEEIPKDYMGLRKIYSPCHIESEEECKRASEMIDALAEFDGLNESQLNYLSTLSLKVDEYEETMGV